jgi:hypothetical protein
MPWVVGELELEGLLFNDVRHLFMNGRRSLFGLTRSENVQKIGYRLLDEGWSFGQRQFRTVHFNSLDGYLLKKFTWEAGYWCSGFLGCSIPSPPSKRVLSIENEEISERTQKWKLFAWSMKRVHRKKFATMSTTVWQQFKLLTSGHRRHPKR